MKLNKITSAVFVAAAMMSAAAHADTYTVDLSAIGSTKVSFIDQLMSFDGFDVTKGTLTGVTLDIYSKVNAQVDLTNNNTSDRTLDVSIPVTLKLIAPGGKQLDDSARLLSSQLTVGKKVGATAGTASDTAEIILHSSTSYSGADLSLFTAQSTLSSELSVAATAGLNVNRVKAIYSNTATGYGHVTYTFTPTAPVPEPETYGMLLAGLAVLGVVAKRSKRSA